MTQPAKAHEPSMEEILASIRRIIADDDVKPEAAAAAPPAAAPAPPAAPAQAKAAPPPAAAAKPAPAPPPKPAPPPAAKAPEPKPAPPPAAPAAAAPNNQDDIDALLAGLDADTSEDEVRASPEPAPAEEEDVLELTEQMEVAEEEPQSFKTIQPHDDIEFSEAAEVRPAEPRQQERPHVPVPPPVRPFEESEPVQPQQPLMSQQTATAVNSAFNALAQTVLSNNARTLEDLVKEMLRPMLRSWLDDNLPGLVEKIVRAEIERVSRGR
jgi:cell pole-organizing protein PopZ